MKPKASCYAPCLLHPVLLQCNRSLITSNAPAAFQAVQTTTVSLSFCYIFNRLDLLLTESISSPPSHDVLCPITLVNWRSLEMCLFQGGASRSFLFSLPQKAAQPARLDESSCMGKVNGSY